MEKIQVKGVEVTFADLRESAQSRLYLQDKERFKFDAARSSDFRLRKLVVRQATTLEVLDEVFKAELEIYESSEIIKLIWKHKNFERTEHKRQLLAKSKKPEIRMIVADCKDSSSDFLNEMLINEVMKYNDKTVEYLILNNSNFKMEQRTLEILKETKDSECRRMTERYLDYIKKS